MAIERMKLLSITGREERIDEFIVQYLLESGLQTENAVKVFEKGWKLTNFKYDSKPKELLKTSKKILDANNIKYKEKYAKEDLTRKIDFIESEINQIQLEFENLQENIKNKNAELTEANLRKEILERAKEVDVDIDKLYKLEYMKFRYGKISKENYEKLEKSLRDLNSFLLEIAQDEDYLWIICITAKDCSAKVDSYLNLFKFERIWIPSELDGNPKEMMKKCEEDIRRINFELTDLNNEKIRFKNKYTDSLLEDYAELNLYIKVNSVKKYMAHDENGLFYIIGWIPTDELKQLLPKLSKEKEIKFVVKSHDEVASIPPTKLKNIGIIKPFETIVKMYGLPNYNELDPTLFVAITAFLLFGFMFGDVGHGLVIFLIGIIMAKKKITLGPVLEAGGIASMIFGVLYGSIFGKEEMIPAILIRPMENIQTMLIYGIAIGVILIIISMILNIKNGLKNDDKEKVFFDTNGFAGLIFYLTILISGVYFFVKGKMIASVGILSVFVVLPLVAIMFKDKISEIVFKEGKKEKSSLIEKIFEVVEILLSFASNTISFVRIAAFAINHVGLCMAIYILSNMVSGAGNIAVSIIGNVIVIVLEGLIVGIQVLRLEYYELFSRFYTGDGKEYTPLKEKI